MSREEVARLNRLRLLKARVDTELADLEWRTGQPAPQRRRHAICGTDSGYYHHRRIDRGPACEPCKKAHAQAERDRARRVRIDEAEVA